MLAVAHARTRTRFYDQVRDYRHPFRELMVEHLLSTKQSGPLNLLSLPGKGWPGEKLLASRTKRKLHVMAVEGDRKAYLRVMASMPVGMAATWYFGNLSAFLQQTPFMQFNAVWLDTTNQVGKELFAICRNLKPWLAQGPVPFALTFAYGREHHGEAHDLLDITGGTKAEQRIRVLKELLAYHCNLAPNFKAYRYTASYNPMGCLCGFLYP